MVADMEEVEKLDASVSHARRLNAKEVHMPKMVNMSYSRSPTEESNCLEEIKFSENPPQYWIIQHEAKSMKMIFKERPTGLNR